MAEKTKKGTAVPEPRSSVESEKSTAPGPKSAVDRTMDLSEDLLESVENGQRVAIEAVRRFVDTIDEALPAMGGHPSRREKVIDAAMELADNLVTTQYEFLRGVVREAGRAVTKPGGEEK